MLEFLKPKHKEPLSGLPELLKPEDPVNYNSVLDYLTGLSKADYSKIIKSADIYREANAKVAKVVGVKDEPTHQLMPTTQTGEEQEKDLDTMLEADDLSTAFLDDDAPAAPKPQKPQAPGKPKQIDIKD